MGITVDSLLWVNHQPCESEHTKAEDDDGDVTS